jgi:hypothetical protein
MSNYYLERTAVAQKTEIGNLDQGDSDFDDVGSRLLFHGRRMFTTFAEYDEIKSVCILLHVLFSFSYPKQPRISPCSMSLMPGCLPRGAGQEMEKRNTRGRSTWGLLHLLIQSGDSCVRSRGRRVAETLHRLTTSCFHTRRQVRRGGHNLQYQLWYSPSNRCPNCRFVYDFAPQFDVIAAEKEFPVIASHAIVSVIVVTDRRVSSPAPDDFCVLAYSTSVPSAIKSLGKPVAVSFKMKCL